MIEYTPKSKSSEKYYVTRDKTDRLSDASTAKIASIASLLWRRYLRAVSVLIIYWSILALVYIVIHFVRCRNAGACCATRHYPLVSLTYVCSMNHCRSVRPRCHEQLSHGTSAHAVNCPRPGMVKLSIPTVYFCNIVEKVFIGISKINVGLIV